MKIKGLLRGQEIILDPHGHYEMRSFDDQRYDFHLHKKTKYEIDGKKWTVDIRIPLNSNRNITITRNKELLLSIPHRLEKEIRDVLDDKKTRNDFLRDIKKALIDYPNDFQDEENVRLCIKRICIAFGFDWENCDVDFLFHQADVVDEDRELYRVTIGENEAKIEDMMKKK